MLLQIFRHFSLGLMYISSGIGNCAIHFQVYCASGINKNRWIIEFFNRIHHKSNSQIRKKERKKKNQLLIQFYCIVAVIIRIKYNTHVKRSIKASFFHQWKCTNVVVHVGNLILNIFPAKERRKKYTYFINKYDKLLHMQDWMTLYIFQYFPWDTERKHRSCAQWIGYRFCFYVRGPLRFGKENRFSTESLNSLINTNCGTVKSFRSLFSYEP